MAIRGDDGMTYFSGNVGIGVSTTTGRFQVLAGGTTTLYVKSSDGYVGIGTTDPDIPLKMVTNIAGEYGLASGVYDPDMSGGDAIYTHIGNANQSKDVGNIGFRYSGVNSDNNMLTFGFHSANYLFNIKAGGNVGVGTSAPSMKFEVNGGIKVASTTAVAPSNGTIVYNSTDNDFYGYKNGAWASMTSGGTSLWTRDAGDGWFTSQPFANPSTTTLSLNADGLSENAFLRIELIDKYGELVRNYSGESAAVVKTSGLKTKVVWPGGELIKCANASYRVRVTFAGADAAKIKFYVGYLE